VKNTSLLRSRENVSFKKATKGWGGGGESTDFTEFGWTSPSRSGKALWRKKNSRLKIRGVPKEKTTGQERKRIGAERYRGKSNGRGANQRFLIQVKTRGNRKFRTERPLKQRTCKVGKT